MSNQDQIELDEFIKELSELQLTVDEIQVRLQNLQKSNAELKEELKKSQCQDVGVILEEVPSDNIRFGKDDGEAG